MLSYSTVNISINLIIVIFSGKDERVISFCESTFYIIMHVFTTWLDIFRYKFNFDRYIVSFVFNLYEWSLQNIAHITAAVLSEYILNLAAIFCPFINVAQFIRIKFELQWALI